MVELGLPPGSSIRHPLEFNAACYHASAGKAIASRCSPRAAEKRGSSFFAQVHLDLSP